MMKLMFVSIPRRQHVDRQGAKQISYNIIGSTTGEAPKMCRVMHEYAESMLPRRNNAHGEQIDEPALAGPSGGSHCANNEPLSGDRKQETPIAHL